MYNTWPIENTMNFAGYVADAACCVSPSLSALSADSAERSIGCETNTGRTSAPTGGAFLMMATTAGTKFTGEGLALRMLPLLQSQRSRQHETAAWPQRKSDPDRRLSLNGGTLSLGTKLSGITKVRRGGDLAN